MTMTGIFCQSWRRIKEAQPRFVITGKESERLDVNFDKSIGYQGRILFIVASSNGFLLCTRKRERPVRYYVYNPATGQSIALPKAPRKSHHNIGFSCKVVDPEDIDLCSFTVVRYESTCPTACSTVTMECFSSKTGEWNVINLIAAHASFGLSPTEDPAVEVDGIFFWLDAKFVACDMVENTCWLLDLPVTFRDEMSWCFGVVNGVLYYACTCAEYLGIWALEGQLRSRSSVHWVMKFRSDAVASVLDDYSQMLGLVVRDMDLALVGFHPSKTGVVYLRIRNNVVVYDFNTGVGELVCVLDCVPARNMSRYKFFPYEQPRLLL